MSLKKKIIFNTLIQFVNRFVVAGSAFVISILIARYFGARGFGEYSKATTYLGVFYLFADFGINAVVLKEITDNPESESKTIRNLLGLRLIAGLILTLLAIVITFFLPYDLAKNEGFTPVAKMSMISLSVLILYQAFINTGNVIFQKHLKYEKSTLSNIIASVVTFITVVVLLLLKSSLPQVLLSYTVGAIAGGITLYFFVKQLFKCFTPLFDFRNWKKLIIAGLPLGLTLVFNLVYFRADIFILTIYRTTAEVGTYGLAYKFFEFAITLPTFFANSLYPILLIRKTDRRLFKETVIKAGLFLLAVSILVMIGFYIASPLLKFVREDFIPSIAVLKLLSFSLPIFFLSSLFMWILITFGKNKELLLIYFLGMIINIILNLMFIPTYGIVAASLVTLVSEFFILIVSGWFAFTLL